MNPNQDYWLVLNNLTQEQLCSFILRIIKEFIRFILFNNFSGIHKDNSISYFLCKTHFVGNTDHGHAFFGQFDHNIEHFRNHFRIEQPARA